MSTQDDSNNIAVKYLGRTLYIVVFGIILYVLACKGYSIYITASQEKIEVQTTNSNFTNLNSIE